MIGGREGVVGLGEYIEVEGVGDFLSQYVGSIERGRSFYCGRGCWRVNLVKEPARINNWVSAIKCWLDELPGGERSYGKALLAEMVMRDIFEEGFRRRELRLRAEMAPPLLDVGEGGGGGDLILIDLDNRALALVDVTLGSRKRKRGRSPVNQVLALPVFVMSMNHLDLKSEGRKLKPAEYIGLVGEGIKRGGYDPFSCLDDDSLVSMVDYGVGFLVSELAKVRERIERQVDDAWKKQSALARLELIGEALGREW